MHMTMQDLIESDEVSLWLLIGAIAHAAAWLVFSSFTPTDFSV